MRSFRIIILENVELEIKSSIDYVANNLENPQAAKSLETKVRKTISSLKHSPCRSHIVDNIYSVSIGRYKLYYKVVSNNVVLFKFIHTLRQFNPKDYL